MSVVAYPASRMPDVTRTSAHLRPRIPRYLTFASWLVCVCLMGLVGSVLGPGWNPQPMAQMVVPETSDTSVSTASATPSLGTYRVTTSLEKVHLRDGSVVTAELKRPVGAGENLPAMVFIHGTGTNGYDAFERETSLIASAGVVTLTPQKRVDNYSNTYRDYYALADDYEDALEHLREDEGVDARRVGIYAVSEGCFIAPIIAARNHDVAFVAFISAPVIPIRFQGAFASDAYLREIGAPVELRRAIPKLMGQEFGDGTFQYIDFDPSPFEAQMTMPVFMAYGTLDNSMPMIQGPTIMRDQLAKADNHALTVRYYKNADHGLQTNRKALDKHAMRDIATWVNGLPFSATASPHVAGATPQQEFQAAAFQIGARGTAGPAAVWVLVGGVGLIVVGGLLGLATLIRRRGRRLGSFRGAGAATAWGSVFSVVSWVALFAYLLVVVYIATHYEQNLWAVRGGWLVVRVLALLAVWFMVSACVHWVTGRRRNPATSAGPLAVIAFGTSILGQFLLLLALGYWNVLPALF
ncbi:alpha/beta hydrolase family protein [Neoactinobaculum massilliense]|mgnify:CR=1 FL=1|uniref:alpha/beta hydrolase family protein n=1 Tax=Neoactinobaculum massilliense TaxID=2364794 RepID=UPI000F521759|nr:prolyl oligopeptidase family serine peptidase [Neoactinobaculum massilliense]